MTDFWSLSSPGGTILFAGETAIDAVSDWWYGDSSELAQTTVPDYGESAIDVPSSPAPSNPPRSTSTSTSTSSGNGAPSPTNGGGGGGSSISPVWIAAGVALVGIGGWYAYRSSR